MSGRVLIEPGEKGFSGSCRVVREDFSFVPRRWVDRMEPRRLRRGLGARLGKADEGRLVTLSLKEPPGV